MAHEDVTADPSVPPPRQVGPIAAQPDMPGSAIGPYKFISLLGEGGFGSVYLAEQSSPVQRRVAIKLIRPGMDSRSVLARFEAERQALAMMDHPSVAKVFDGGVTQFDRPYFVMELVRGEPITRFCELERLSIENRVRLMIQVCGAIHHAHIKGVLHRDLKPTNVLVSLVDGDPLPKVIDFGVAKALHHPLSDTPVYTEVGQMIGTPEYMSPEQARGSVDVDTRADIYALGAILYEILTGVTPIDLKESRRAGVAQVERAIEQFHPAAPSQRLSQLIKTGMTPPSRSSDIPSSLRLIRGELDWIVLKCLEKERSRRYDSAAALADDLERYLNDEPVMAGPPSVTYRAMKFVRRHRVAVGAAIIVALSLVGGVIGTGYGFAKATREMEAAKLARDESEAVTAFLTEMIQSVQPEDFGKDVTVREVLDQSSARLAIEFAERPIVEARLRHALGVSYWSLGRLEDAEQHLPAVVELRRKVLGPDHPDTLGATANLASLRLEQGRLQDAEVLLKEVVDSASRTLGDEHRITLGSMNNLAVVYAQRGAKDDALALHRRVLDGQKRAQGPYHAHTLGAQVNLGDHLAGLGRFDEADQVLRQAAADWESHHGPNHPGTMTAIFSLAMMELDRGRTNEAERLMRRVAETRIKTLGDDHADTLAARANLGIILTRAGRLEEAEHELTLAWVGLRKALGDHHPNTLTVMDQLIGILEQQDWPARAESTVRQIIEFARVAAQRVNANPSDLNGLAWTLLHVKPAELRDMNGALQAAARACELERAAGGPDLWMYLDTLAVAQYQSGDSAAALASQREALGLLPATGERYRAEMEQRAAEYEQAAAAPR